MPSGVCRSVCAEVDPLYLFVGNEIFAGVGQLDLTGLQDVAALRSCQRDPGVLLDEEDRRALGVDALDRLKDLADDDRRKAEPPKSSIVTNMTDCLRTKVSGLT